MWRTDGTTATQTINAGPVWGVTDVTRCDTVKQCVTSVTFVQFLHNQGAASPSTPMTSWKPGPRCCPGDLLFCLRCIQEGRDMLCWMQLLHLHTAVHCVCSALCVQCTVCAVHLECSALFVQCSVYDVHCAVHFNAVNCTALHYTLQPSNWKSSNGQAGLCSLVFWLWVGTLGSCVLSSNNINAWLSSNLYIYWLKKWYNVCIRTRLWIYVQI